MNNKIMNRVVFDVETKYSFDEVGGQQNLDKLGVSALVAYSYDHDKFMGFAESDMPSFERLITQTPTQLIGFNSIHFDNAVITPYLSINVAQLPHIDIMQQIERIVGHRVSLNSVAEATLGVKKSADGLKALEWYKEGKIAEIIAYCQKDVELTRDLYEYGLNHGRLFFKNKMGEQVAASGLQFGAAGQNLKDLVIQAVQEGRQLEIDYVDMQNAANPLRGIEVVEVHSFDGDSFSAFSTRDNKLKQYFLRGLIRAKLLETQTATLGLGI